MAKFINTQQSWDGAKICEVGDEVEFSGTVIPPYYEPADDEAKAMKDAYEKSLADKATEAIAEDAQSEDDSHDDADAVNPYKALPNKTAVLAVCAERKIVPPASATRADLEALLIAEDAKEAASEPTAQAATEATAEDAQSADTAQAQG